MVGLLLMFGGFLLAPLPIALGLGIIIYTVLGITELSQGIVSPITQTSLLLFLLSTLALFIGGSVAWLPYMGSVFLGTLFIVSAGFLIAGRPFTVFYSAGRGHRGKHWVVSGLWTMAYLAGGLLALLLMPDVSFIYAPMLVIVGTAVLTLFFNLVWFGAATRRTTAFEYKGFRFTEIGDDPMLLTHFYKVVAREFWTSVRHSPHRSVDSLARLENLLRANDQLYEDRILRFMAWKNEKPVGAICCILDDSQVGLPVEEESSLKLSSHLRFNRLRKVGRIMEISNFAIASSYRAHQSLFLGLLRCAIEVAMEQRISFIINESYLSQVGLYRKIGFTEIILEPSRSASGVQCMVLALNLSTAVVYESNREANTSMNELTPLLNSYLAERCYHRLVLGHFWHKRQYRSYDLPIFELQIKNQGK